MRAKRMEQPYKHPDYDLMIHVDDGVEYVEIPHTHTGYGSGPMELANSRYIESDAELQQRLNLSEASGLFGSMWRARVEGYDMEQFKELEGLVTDLEAYPIICESTYHEVEEELMLDFLRMELDHGETVSEGEVLEAIGDLCLVFEHEGDGHYFISETDFQAAVQHAKEKKKEKVAA